MTNRDGKTGAVPLANRDGKTGAVPMTNRDGKAGAVPLANGNGNGNGTATAGGPFRRETIHNQHRRSYWHDYHEAGLYMLTMVVEGRKRLFGTIVGSAKGRAGTVEAPHMALSELGRRVLEEEVPKIHRFYPMVEVWRVAIMPDHIHH